MESTLLNAMLHFAAYFVSGFAVLWLFAICYWKYTPLDEVKLIRNGNIAAGVSFSGAILGFGISVAKSIEQSVDAIDFLIWAIVAGLLQMFAFKFVHLIFKDLAEQIESGKVSYAITYSVFAITLGLLASASMSM